jgi:glycosyltransferase involved in cell wall biosynthesis
MKILHVLPEFAKGGGERVAIDLANHAVARGHQVSMLASAAVDPALMPVPLDPRVNVRFVSEGRPSRMGRYAAIVPWLLHNRRWLRDQDVVHCHMSFGAVTGTVIQLLRFLLRSPNPTVVETYHAVGMPVPFVHRVLHAWMARRRDAVALMATDPFWYRFLQKHPRCRLIPNGIQFTGTARSGDEVRAYREQQARIPPTGKLVVGTVGRMAPERRPEQFIPIFAAVQRLLGRDVHLLLAGAGPELKKVQALVREYGLERQVHLPGLVLDPVLAMKAMDLYITLAIGPVPGVAAIEAAFCGVPVIAIQMVPSYQAQADDWIWSSTESAAVAHEAIRLLSDPVARARLAARQAAFVQAHHTVEVMASSYYALYDIAINGRQSSVLAVTAGKSH